jgi:hypothetical protein
VDPVGLHPLLSELKRMDRNFDFFGTDRNIEHYIV